MSADYLFRHESSVLINELENLIVWVYRYLIMCHYSFTQYMIRPSMHRKRHTRVHQINVAIFFFSLRFCCIVRLVYGSIVMILPW